MIKRIKQRKTHGPPKTIKQDISSIGCCTSVTSATSFIRGAHTKPPQSCDERKPAPPDEEQFNAPAAGGHAMKERIKIRLNKEKLTGHRGVKRE